MKRDLPAAVASPSGQWAPPQGSPSGRRAPVRGRSPDARRVRTRSGSGGTAQRAAESGPCDRPCHGSAATAVRPRRPRSFQLRTKARRLLVHDCGSGRGEREPPSRALAAPAHRPGRGRSAALADWRRYPAQALQAGFAQLWAGGAADDTPARKQQVEHACRAYGRARRLCVSSAPKDRSLPPAARGSRCRTSHPEPATCRRRLADRATRRSRPGWSGLFPAARYSRMSGSELRG